jgi:hypothetical protein
MLQRMQINHTWRAAAAAAAAAISAMHMSELRRPQDTPAAQQQLMPPASCACFGLRDASLGSAAT